MLLAVCNIAESAFASVGHFTEYCKDIRGEEKMGPRRRIHIAKCERTYSSS